MTEIPFKNLVENDQLISLQQGHYILHKYVISSGNALFIATDKIMDRQVIIKMVPHRQERGREVDQLFVGGITEQIHAPVGTTATVFDLFQLPDMPDCHFVVMEHLPTIPSTHTEQESIPFEAGFLDNFIDNLQNLHASERASVAIACTEIILLRLNQVYVSSLRKHHGDLKPSQLHLEWKRSGSEITIVSFKIIDFEHDFHTPYYDPTSYFPNFIFSFLESDRFAIKIMALQIAGILRFQNFNIGEAKEYFSIELVKPDLAAEHYFWLCCQILTTPEIADNINSLINFILKSLEEFELVEFTQMLLHLTRHPNYIEEYQRIVNDRLQMALLAKNIRAVSYSLPETIDPQALYDLIFSVNEYPHFQADFFNPDRFKSLLTGTFHSGFERVIKLLQEGHNFEELLLRVHKKEPFRPNSIRIVVKNPDQGQAIPPNLLNFLNDAVR